MAEARQRVYEFGGFRLDAVKRLLWREGEPVPLTSKSFETLLALVESRGEILDKEALLNRVWPDTVVEEKNLTINISALRKALGESPQEHRYIVTVPGRGYRFVAEVRDVTDGGAELLVQQSKVRVVVEEEDEETERRGDGATGRDAVVPSPRRPIARVAIAAALLAVLVVAFVTWRRGASQREPTAGPPAIKSLAVLPFKPLNPQAGEDFLGVGMADVTITRLSSLNQLIVRPTRAVLPFATQDPLEAGRALKVDAVLDGNIQQAAGRVRVTLRLLQVEDGKALWTYQCDEYCTDLFALQDTISQKVTEALAVKLTGDERAQMLKRYTENADAYQAYLKGRYYYNRVNEDDLNKAIASFQQALRLDPNDALADAGLSAVYAWGAQFYWRAHEAMPKAREMAERALALDEQLAEAHASLARVRYFYEWDYAAAEREFRRALELNPGLADAHLWYGEYLALMGRFDEALAEMKQAAQLDPLTPFVVIHPGLPTFLAGRYDESIAYALKGLEIDPNVRMIHIDLGLTYAMKGDYAKGIAELQRAIELGDHSPAAQTNLAFAYARAGDRTAAQQRLKQALSSPNGYVVPYFVATVYAALGDQEQAFAWLEKAYNERSIYLAWLKTDPRLDSLRADPRFADLLRRVGFAQ
ncbi:MAG TPA: winged helix-turn-helix domain-containing protein [Blastocatellia bacterium]|nr:winged helix-turn-helix domain-containing protein [Blastocatellia bacterium]